MVYNPSVSFFFFYYYLLIIAPHKFAYPLHNADEPRDGCVLVTPLGICVEVHPLLLKDQLRRKKIRNANVGKKFK